MPPLKGIDRGINGNMLKALEESGHGRRIAIVDASYNIPRWAQVVDYRGENSVQALLGILSLVPLEGDILLMHPDADDKSERSDGPFCDIAVTELDGKFNYPAVHAVNRLDTGGGENGTIPGFYTLANDETVDTLFVRTIDRMPYACSTFIVGHSQE